MYWNLLPDLFTENKFYKTQVLILSCCRSLKSYQLQCPFKLQNLGLQLSKNHNNKNEHGGIVVKQQCLQWFEGYLNPPPCKKISKNIIIAFHIIIAGGSIMKAGRKAILFSLNNFSCCIWSAPVEMLRQTSACTEQSNLIVNLQFSTERLKSSQNYFY